MENDTDETFEPIPEWAEPSASRIVEIRRRKPFVYLRYTDTLNRICYWPLLHLQSESALDARRRFLLAGAPPEMLAKLRLSGVPRGWKRCPWYETPPRPLNVD